MKKIKIYFQLMLVCITSVHRALAAGYSIEEKELVRCLLDLTEQRHDEARAQDIATIRQLGPECIPVLIDLVGVDTKTVHRIVTKSQDEALKSYYNAFDDKDDAVESLVGLGLSGFGILGTNAEGAVPQLANMFAKRGEDLGTIALALGAVGPNGFSVLTNAVGDSDANVRDAVIRALGKSGNWGPETVRQILMNSLKDSNDLVRLHAANLLLNGDPALAVPVLVSLLDSGDKNIRLIAAASLHDKDPQAVIASLIPLLDVREYSSSQSDLEKASVYGQCLSASKVLGSYGRSAHGAAPKMFSVFTNIVLGTNRYLAKNLGGNLIESLQEIDPEMAKKAEDFIFNDGPLGVLGFGWTETRLQNGMELIAGGVFHAETPDKTNYVFARAQLFDPASGTRIETGSMNFARYGHRASLEEDGKVLVTGGYCSRYGETIETNEVYEPASARWTTVLKR